MKTIKKIICPVDVYDFQPEAAEYAATLAKALDARIFVMHVMEPVPTPYVGEGYTVSMSDHKKNEERVKQEAEEKLAEIIARFGGDCQVDGEVILGRAADKILQVSEERAGDMVIMASHGRSFWGRAIHGSVTNRVIANAKIPVLVINPVG
ncbi:putative UspA domain protein [uncultured delta proteobacterium]|uniref:Putative UspA domain protein n=1 Tax=uncultured delta proteobacterium TaxID=34034 RepID=A0A212JVX5_9DELT|nr:putative UspA domain protein [uncultured delta proteobacterium]